MGTVLPMRTPKENAYIYFFYGFTFLVKELFEATIFLDLAIFAVLSRMRYCVQNKRNILKSLDHFDRFVFTSFDDCRLVSLLNGYPIERSVSLIPRSIFITDEGNVLYSLFPGQTTTITSSRPRNRAEGIHSFSQEQGFWVRHF